MTLPLLLFEGSHSFLQMVLVDQEQLRSYGLMVPSLVFNGIWIGTGSPSLGWENVRCSTVGTPHTMRSRYYRLIVFWLVSYFGWNLLVMLHWLPAFGSIIFGSSLDPSVAFSSWFFGAVLATTSACAVIKFCLGLFLAVKQKVQETRKAEIARLG